jgi:MYXO-CTERM domain-containing protein
VTGAPHGTRSACTNAGMECGGTCDGVVSSMCKYAPQSTACGVASCESGSESQSACDGQGNCAAQPEKLCSPYTCGAKACKSTCAGDADCSVGNECKPDQSCGPVGAMCHDDHTATDGPCDPYKCAGGACKQRCTSNADCVAPNACDETGSCVPPPMGGGGGTMGGCGCRTTGDPQGSAAALGALCFALAALRRRRFRASIG